MMLDDRKLDVLRAVVVDYVSSHEPVGSRALVERHRLDVSPATIRNDMAALEEEGYLTQPHTSAGRIPTDKGYRLFVDRLAAVKPLSSAERRAIEVFMQGAVDIDDVVARTARLLAQITRQVAMVLYPAASPASLRHIEVVQVAPGRLMVVTIRSNGGVDQRIVECSPLDESEVGQLGDWINKVVANVAPDQAVIALGKALDQLEPNQREQVAPVAKVITDLLQAPTFDRVAVGGVPNLARFGIEYETMVAPILEAIEEQVVLLRLLGEAAQEVGDVTVRIGAENPYEPLREVSVVTSPYAPQGSWAALGVVGPTRMDYPATITTVRAVARYVSRFLGGDVDGD